MSEKRKVVALLSGGLDSTVAVAMARASGAYEIIEAINVLYGQKHERERMSARDVADAFGVRFHKATFPPLEGSALTDADRNVPTDGRTEGIAPTFVPARNALMITYAANRAALLGATAIITGVNAVDYSGYPDCRPLFILSIQNTLRIALDCPSLHVHAPLMNMSKDDIVTTGVRLGAPIHLTWSCYQGGSTPCRVCDSCRIRAAGFKAAGVSDPALAEEQ